MTEPTEAEDRRRVVLFADGTSHAFEGPEDAEEDFVSWTEGSPVAILSDGTVIAWDKFVAIFSWDGFTEYRSRQQ